MKKEDIKKLKEWVLNDIKRNNEFEYIDSFVLDIIIDYQKKVLDLIEYIEKK